MIDVSNINIEPILDTLQILKINDSEYFSSKYSDYISNSRLSLINPKQDNNPEAFFSGISNKYSDALIFGSVVHELFLQPNLFHLVTTVNRPIAKLGFMADELYPIYKEKYSIDESDLLQASDKVNYYKNKLNSDRQKFVINSCLSYWRDRLVYEFKNTLSTPIYLDEKSRIRVINCLNALKNNDEIQKLQNYKGLWNDGINNNEQAILLNVKVSIPNKDSFVLKIKAKLDNYIIDPISGEIIINDLKTIGKDAMYFKDNFDRYRYDRELSEYSWLLSLVAKKYYKLNNFKIKSNCLVVSTIPPYNTSIYEVTKQDFQKGWNEFVYLLKLVAHYYNKGFRFK